MHLSPKPELVHMTGHKTCNNFHFFAFSMNETQSKANQPIAKGMLLCLFISFKMIMFQKISFLFVCCNIQDFCLERNVKLPL